MKFIFLDVTNAFKSKILPARLIYVCDTMQETGRNGAKMFFKISKYTSKRKEFTDHFKI